MSDPLPLTPPRSDLRDFGFMPLEITRFRGSGLMTEDAEVVVAALMLYTAAWHETPAASLVDNDKALAKAAGYGRAVETWLSVKEGALRGFVKCSDGRLYHPVVARLANEAWKSKLEQRWRSEVGRRRKWNERHDDDQLAIPSFEAFASVYPDECPNDKALMSQGQLGLVAATEPQCPPEIGSKGESRDRDRDRDSNITTATGAARPAKKPSEPPAPDLMSIVERIATAGGVSLIQPAKLAREMDIVKGWIAKGISVEDTILPAIAHRLGQLPDGETVGGLAFFDASILKRHGKAKPATRSTKAEDTLNDTDDDDARIVDLRNALKRQLGPRTYDGWLKPGVTAIHVNGTSLTIRASSAFLADWISANLSDKIREAVSASGLPSEIRIGT